MKRVMKEEAISSSSFVILNTHDLRERGIRMEQDTVCPTC